MSLTNMGVATMAEPLLEQEVPLKTRLRRAERLDLTTLSVALRQLRNLGGVTAAAGAS